MCVIAPMFPFPRENPSLGPDNVICNLVEEIIRIDSNISIDIVTIHNEAKDKFVDERYPNVRVHYYPRIKYLPRNIVDPYIIKHFLQKNNFDLIHSHCPFALSKSMSISTPKILTLHGIYHIEKKFVKNPLSVFLVYDYGTFLLKRILPKLDGFVAISPYVIDELKALNLDRNIKKIYQINNPIDKSFFGVNKYNKSFSSKHILYYPAIINPRKNQTSVINAIKLVKDKMINFELILTGNCGDKKYLATIEELIRKLNLCEQVFYLGKVQKNEIIRLYSTASIIYLLSLQETQSVTILEAMATGNIIIASNIKSNLYLIKDGVNGYLVDPNDSKKISELTINLLLDKQKRITMGENARDIAQKEYRADAIASKTLEMYRDILNRIN